MDSGTERYTRTTATTVAAPDTSFPSPRTAPAVESAAPAVDTLVDTGPIPAVAGPAPTTAPPATPVPAPLTHPCRCGHDRDAHEHFRRGTDCAACDCARFRKPGLLARLRG